MTVRQIGFRVKAEGKVEIKRDLQEIGSEGKAAGQAISQSMSGAARSTKEMSREVDQQTAKLRAQRAAAQELKSGLGELSSIQARINKAVGVDQSTGLTAASFMSADETKWRAQARAAKEAAMREEHEAATRAKLESVLSYGGGKSARDSAAAFEAAFAAKEASARGGLSRQELASRLNLARQGADVFTTAAMGMNPGMIAIQQGPQILDALATSGIRATPALLGLGAAVTGVATAVGIAAVSQAKYEASIKGVEVATKGLGAAAGVTADGVVRQAEAAAAAGEISRSAARQYAAEYVSTGKIGTGVLQDLVAMTKDYAATTRQDAAGATKELAAAFANPAKGAADLNDKLHFLRGAELEHIENLARAGREAEAQAILVDKLKGAMIDASDATTGWGHALDGLKTKALNALDSVGKVVDRLVTGGDANQRVQDLRSRLALAKGAVFPQKDLIDSLQKQLDAEYQSYVAEMNRKRDAVLSVQDSDRKALVARYNPDAARLAQARADRENLLRLGTSDEASKKALTALNKEIDALEKGYKNAGAAASALAKAQREAAKDSRDAARKAAEAKRDADDLALRRLREDVMVARAGGDAAVIANAEQELRLREMIIQRERDGLGASAARLEAERQISRELLAQAAALKAENGNASLAKQGFMSAEARMAKVYAEMGDFKGFTAKTALFESLRLNTRQAFGDGLMEAMDGGDFFKVFASRLKYAAASALVRTAADGLFGNREGTKTGLIAAAIKGIIPGFAKGTNNAPGGLALVGEKGPELVDLPGGSRVFTAEETRRLTAASQAGMGRGGAMNFTYAPQYTVTGGDAEAIKRLEAVMAQDRAEFSTKAVAAIIDAKSRRVPGVG